MLLPRRRDLLATLALGGGAAVLPELVAAPAPAAQAAAPTAGTCNVKDYSAVGDGRTDDTAAFTRAVREAATFATSGLAAGATVLVPPGKYVVDSNLVIPTKVELLLMRGAWIQRPATSARTDPMVTLNGNGAKARGGRIESLVAAPDGVLVVGNTTDTKVSKGSIASRSAVLTVTTRIFKPRMVGWNVSIKGAGPAGTTLYTTISSYRSATQVTLTQAASTTVTRRRVLAGAGGRNVNWCVVEDVEIYGRNAAAGSGDIGLKFNSYPQGGGLLTAQNRATNCLVWGHDHGVVFGPEANANSITDFAFYQIKSNAIWFNNSDESRCSGGFVSASTDSVAVRMTNSTFSAVLGLATESGGANARPYVIDMDSQHNHLWMIGNVARSGVDDGTKNVLVTNAVAQFNSRDVEVGALRLQDVGALPAASALYRGQVRVRYGGRGKADDLVVCLRAADGSHSWVSATDRRAR